MHAKRRAASLLLGVVLAGCGSTPGPTASPVSPAASLVSPAGSSAAPAPSPTAPVSTAAPSQAPTDPFLGTVVVTISDNLVVRSEPRVSDDSIIYEPWLPLGTELTVLAGPVSASGYTWYEVAPVSFAGLDGPGHGWVAMAGKDGEAWIAPAQGPTGPTGVELAQADVARAPTDPKDAKTAAASITAFGLDLYRALLADPKLDLGTKNVVFSPTSVALALGLARAGARGATAAQMDTVLHTSGWDALGAGLNALDQALAARNAVWQEGGATKRVSLQITNAAFGQRGWAIEQGFLDAIAAAFGAGLRLVDYLADPEGARVAINRWVSDQTAGRIPELLGPRDVTNLTRLYLVNAIYLKAEWEDWFDAARPAPFTRLDGSRVQVPTMSQNGGQHVPYTRGTGWQAVELRYLGADYATPLAMTLIVPDDLVGFESRLSASQLERITTALGTQRERLQEVTTPQSEQCEPGTYPYAVELFMPRFSIDTKADLVPALASLGIGRAFEPDAEFTGIHVPETPDDRLYISNVIHQANIDVDEKGTEAAAATAVGMATTGGCGGPAPVKVITLRLDRPFIFVLRDVETGAVLFMGRVTDPSVKGG